MPIIAPQPCWRRFLEFDTTIVGTTILLRALAEQNVEDLRHNPRLLADLNVRCRSALRGALAGNLGALPGRKSTPPLKYAEEPIDTWQSYAVMAEQFAGQTIVADCDCLSPLWAAFFFVPCGIRGVGLGISQPKTRPCSADERGRVCGHGMAHAYTVLDLRDPRVPAGLARLCVRSPRLPSWVGVFDGSSLAGMGKPKDEFYGSGEHAIKWLRDEEERDGGGDVSGLLLEYGPQVTRLTNKSLAASGHRTSDLGPVVGWVERAFGAGG